MNFHKALLLALPALIFVSCKKTSGSRSKIPKISNLQQSAWQIDIGSGSTDTLLFQFRFEDGDADIKDGKAKVVFKDVLDTAAVEVDYPFPETNAALDPDLGVTGRALIVLDANAILFQIADTAKKSEVKRYEIYMVDDAGNKSNVLQSDSVVVFN